jgi:hypothetical protein
MGVEEDKGARTCLRLMLESRLRAMVSGVNLEPATDCE